MKKTKVLLVEDEFILYDEISDFLKNNHIEVANYTKSYDEAITQIKIFNPDIVLLDINLEGEKDGIDLGETLKNDFHIPFIYITDFNDQVTFKRALRTKPNHFIKKTKPNLDLNQLLIDIQLVLNNHKETNFNKKGIFVCKDYLDEMKNLQTTKGDFLSKELVEFDDICYITREPYYKTENEKTKTIIRSNYARVVTADNYNYFMDKSLRKIVLKLNLNFVRISDKTIVNISPKYLDGRINKNKISVNGRVFTIGKSYIKEFEKRLGQMYEV